MSTLTASAPERTESVPSRPRREPNIYSRYVGAMLYFMGAALISGAVVHYPLDPMLYSIICAVGALVFLLGTIVNEFILATERPDLRRAISLVAFSLLLSFGVGMVGGSIQHFTQFPERSTVMTPIGLLMSYAAFVAKDAEGRWRHVFSLFGAAFLVVTILTWVGMTALAGTLDSAGHEHGTSQVPAPGEPSGSDQAPADGGPADGGATEGKPGTPQDGHGSHDH